MKRLLFFFFLGPLSMSAQNCTWQTDNQQTWQTDNQQSWQTADVCSTNIALSLFPNPALFDIEIVGLDRPTEGYIFDAIGRFQNRFYTQNRIDITHLSAGVYFIQINNNSLKFIKL